MSTAAATDFTATASTHICGQTKVIQISKSDDQMVTRRILTLVTSQVWYKVGSSYEHGGVTGVSHVLEHMMFKGTEKLAPGEFSRIIAENGGDENAFTGRDYTAYFQTMAADRLPISFELEAQHLRFLTLPEEEFLKELEGVAIT